MTMALSIFNMDFFKVWAIGLAACAIGSNMCLGLYMAIVNRKGVKQLTEPAETSVVKGTAMLIMGSLAMGAVIVFLFNAGIFFCKGLDVDRMTVLLLNIITLPFWISLMCIMCMCLGCSGEKQEQQGYSKIYVV